MEKLRLGVVGVGAVVRAIYQDLYFRSRYADIISVEAICDVRPESMRWFADRYRIGPERCFGDHREMIAAVELDAVAVNTPDAMHRQPVVDALEAGLDVLLAKPLADRVGDAHEMIGALGRTGRLLGVDFHKRCDPRVIEAAGRFGAGEYGQFQVAVAWMIDKLAIADPNHRPRFFAEPDFAQTNTPVSFLTVHLADALQTIVGLRPAEVRATGYKHKLPALAPIAVDGYDLVDTEVRWSNGGLSHLLTGWHLPNTAYANTVQSARIVCTEAMVDLALDRSGYHEITPAGIIERNALLNSPRPDGMVSGYAIASPGRILESILADRRGRLPAEARREMRTPSRLGFDSTLICHAAHESLAAAAEGPGGVFSGPAVDLAGLLQRELGDGATKYL